METKPKTQKPRAALYVRCSTEEQIKGYGIEVQEENLKAFVRSQEYHLQERYIYRDKGYSGSLPVSERPGMQRLFEDARRGCFDIVLVARLDRFFRKSRLLLEAVETLDSYGISFKSISEPFDTSNAMGRFMLQSLGAIAELERETIKERMSGGRLMAAKSGKWVMGTPPYGYRLDKRAQTLKVLPEEAKWVRKFFEWIVYERCSLKEVVRRANNLKIKTWNERMGTKKKTMKLWWPRTLGRILTNEIYTGTAYFRKYKRTHKDIRSWLDPDLIKPKEEWVLVPVPPIISSELLEAAIEQLKKNREFAARKAKRPYLFSKLVYCSICGFKMIANFVTPKTKNSTGSRHYIGAAPRSQPGNTRRCRYCGTVAESRLMPVWETLKLILSDPRFMYEKIDRALKRRSERSRISERLTEVDRELCSLREKRRRLNFVFLEAREVEEREYRAAIGENNICREKLETERSRLQQLLKSEQERNDQVETIKKLFAKLRAKLEDASYATKGRIIHLLVERIDLHVVQNYAQVTFGFPSPQLAVAGASLSKVLRDNSLGSCLTKTFYLTVNVPLISTKEWERAGASWHVIQKGKGYRRKEAASMEELAARKARELYV